MKKIKAKLRVIVKANDQIIAESEDPILWRKVLSTMTGANPLSESSGQNLDSDEPLEDDGDGAIDRFAKTIGVTKEELIGACDPSMKTPYIGLDSRYWESIKKNTPERGPKSVSVTVLALTLLNLWSEVAKLPRPTIKLSKTVTNTINLVDANISRTIKNCEWLQMKSDKIITLNPAQHSKAVAIAKAYCTKKAPEYK
ncbi:MAG: hypothetical protein PHZ04_03650 [Patescibacteria group bacterium]|nr:hypothetical protein [Patescibacteria group bacterium]MDD5294805.1 hypothetical protein [Patescibacteria group bacterium]MDD5554249.1 hypothetical protein [Patescibacteria group bacterium]